MLGVAVLCGGMGVMGEVCAQEGNGGNVSENAEEGGGLAESADRVFLDALLEAGLFRLAEKYCQQKMAAPDVSPAVKAELTMEWMRVVLGQSLAAQGARQAELRQQAERILADFRTQFPESSWLPVVEYQWGLGLLAAAEMACLEGQVNENREKTEEARRLLRQVIRLFKELDKKLEVIPENAPRKTPVRRIAGVKKEWSTPVTRFSEAGLSVWERVSLRNNIQYHLLLAYKCQGESYPAGSRDRLGCMQEAQKQVQVLWGIPEDSQLMWNVKLAEIACLRLEGKFGEVKARLEALAGRPMSEETQMDMLAESIRFYLATGQPEAALALVREEFSPEMIGRSGNADCAVLELQIALWMAAVKRGPAGKEDARQWYSETLMMREQIRAKDTLMWVYRAEILLSGLLKEAVLTEGAEGEDLGMLMLMVENACRAGDLKKALPLCEKAWRKAVAEKNAAVAVRVGVLAAGISYQEGNPDAALEFYRRVSVTFPEHPDAVKNHRLAIYLASELVNDALRNARNYVEMNARPAAETPVVTEVAESETPVAAESSPPAEEEMLMAELAAAFDLYEALLGEHYRLWKEDNPEIASILAQMAELARLRGKRELAVDASRMLVEQTAVGDAAFFGRVRECVRAWNAFFQEVRKRPAAEAESLPKFAAGAVAWAETVGKRMADAPEVERGELLVQNARWRLEFLPENAGRAERELREVLGMKTLPADMRVSAQCLLILATVTQGRSDEVARLLAEIAASTGENGSAAENASALLAILKSLERFSKTARDAKMARQYAELQLLVVALLEKHTEALAAADRDALLLGKAQTLFTLERLEEAVPIYAQAAAAYPKSRAVQTEYARVLAACGEKTKNVDTLKKARDQWRAVEKNSQPKTDAWFAAKYEVIRLYILLGEKEQAGKMLETLRVLYPELGGRQMRQKFEKLFP